MPAMLLVLQSDRSLSNTQFLHGKCPYSQNDFFFNSHYVAFRRSRLPNQSLSLQVVGENKLREYSITN